MTEREIPKYIDVVIVGGGPQGLTLTTHLIQKQRKIYDRLRSIDKSGEWMGEWEQKFHRLEIPHLRSPAVHHPDPDPFALRRFAENRSTELHPPYDLPGTNLFNQFCHQTIKKWQLEEHLIKGEIKDIEIDDQRNPKKSKLKLILNSGEAIIARKVVIATGHKIINKLDWVNHISENYPAEKLCYAHQIDLTKLSLKNEEILIIGGGLTSGHLAIGAIDRGAKVSMMHRRQFYEKLFDADPGWLGPKYLKNFHTEKNWETRYQIIREARNGGSLTPAIMGKLRKSKKVQFHEHCQVVKAEWKDNYWQVHCDNGLIHKFHRIWLATGQKFDINLDPLLHKIQQQHPIEIINGLPVLDPHLRWGNLNLFIMGGNSALRVGPTAQNLSGARMASEHILPALLK